ncbi:MAG: dihydroorotate dehydrogenase electron transfer subunit [Syntrophomonas sp.]
MPKVENGKIISHRQVAEDLWEMELEAPGITAACEPGQFIHVRVGNENDPLLRRPLSLYDVNREAGIIRLLYKVVGQGTRLLTKLAVGDFLDVMGPLGRGFTLPGKPCSVVLVGGGVGIAPLVYLARRLKALECKVTVLYGVVNKEQLAAIEKLESMEVDCLPATADGSAGYKGLVTGLLQDELKENRFDYVYTCGPEPMMAAVARLAREHSLPGEVSLEEAMACGVGACLGCARKLKDESEVYVKVCKDGPVFNLDQVEIYK